MAPRRSAGKAPEVLSAAYLERAGGKVRFDVIFSCTITSSMQFGMAAALPGGPAMSAAVFH